MARKRLLKGANALRVEERIARVPLDIVGPDEGGSGIFKALKELEREGGRAREPRAPEPRVPEARGPVARRRAPVAAKRAPEAVKPAPALTKPAPAKRAPAPAKRAPAPVKRAPAAARRAPAKGEAANPTAAEAEPEARDGAATRLGPHSFSEAERRAIVVCCTEYRNRLPTYLISAKREVELIDSILRKCERAKGAADRG